MARFSLLISITPILIPLIVVSIASAIYLYLKGIRQDFLTHLLMFVWYSLLMPLWKAFVPFVIGSCTTYLMVSIADVNRQSVLHANPATDRQIKNAVAHSRRSFHFDSITPGSDYNDEFSQDLLPIRW